MEVPSIRSPLPHFTVDSTTPKVYHTTIHELFERSVEINGDREAIFFGDEQMTYQRFNKQVNKLAHHLRKRGVRANDIVAIMADRSFEMLIGIYAIIKAGGAYLPLAHADPKGRLKALLEDACPRLLLIQKHLDEKSQNLHEDHVIIEDVLGTYGPDFNPTEVNQPNDLAYVIYTSGSTGMPKGVMVSHESLVNRLQWMQEAYPVSKDDVIIQKTPFTFDVSVWEIFWWALQGARVGLLKPNEEKNPMSIVASIIKFRATVIHFVPSMFSIFLQYVKFSQRANELSHLRTVFTSGEALKANHLCDFNELFSDCQESKLVNLYGPTEATIDVTHYLCPKVNLTGNIPIGVPISNMSTFIIKDNVLVEDGDTGELCLAGVGLAQGYLNRVELTHERFTRHPEDPNEIIYKTGDHARLRADGQIEYIGRVDDQIKIRGIRIELGEIETMLSNHEDVQQCVVVLSRPSDSVTLIVAYYIADEAIDSKELKAHASDYLPVYMIPNFFHRISKLPLTAHGKVDRKALPELSSMN